MHARPFRAEKHYYLLKNVYILFSATVFCYIHKYIHTYIPTPQMALSEPIGFIIYKFLVKSNKMEPILLLTGNGSERPRDDGRGAGGAEVWYLSGTVPRLPGHHGRLLGERPLFPFMI